MSRYRTPPSFQQALEERLRQKAMTLPRARQLVCFERFVARAQQLRADLVLKGGLGLTVRSLTSRATRDVDLSVEGEPEILEVLQAAGRVELGDFMRFEVTAFGPIADDEGVRFKARCEIGGRVYGSPFDVDVVSRSPNAPAPEPLKGHDWLSFADIETPTFELISIEEHIAEKLHAYTKPRQTENSRVKDLPDLGLLASLGELSASALRNTLRFTFEDRALHQLPLALPAPPTKWAASYLPMARDNRLKWASLPELYLRLQEFLDPVLSTRAITQWSPATWRWS